VNKKLCGKKKATNKVGEQPSELLGRKAERHIEKEVNREELGTKQLRLVSVGGNILA